MHYIRKLSVFIILLCGFSLQACNDGPAEETGEAIDEAAEDIGDGIDDAID